MNTLCAETQYAIRTSEVLLGVQVCDTGKRYPCGSHDTKQKLRPFCLKYDNERHSPHTRIGRMVMAHSSQARIVWRGTGQFLHALWWLWSPILDAHPLPYFGQTKVWDEDGKDAARSFCLLRFPSRLYASLPRTHNWLFSLMSTSCRSEASCCHD